MRDRLGLSLFIAEYIFQEVIVEITSYQANGDGATRREWNTGAAGGIVLASVSSAAMARTPASPINGVEKLLAIETIKYRKARYAYCVDNKDWEGFEANFTEDAILDIGDAMNARHPVTGTWTGVSEFGEEFLQSLMAKAADWLVVSRKNIAQTAKRFSQTNTSFHKIFTLMIDIESDTEALSGPSRMSRTARIASTSPARRKTELGRTANRIASGRKPVTHI